MPSKLDMNLGDWISKFFRGGLDVEFFGKIRAKGSLLGRASITRPESRGLGIIYLCSIEKEKRTELRKVYLGDLAGIEDCNLQRVYGLRNLAWASRVRGGDLAGVSSIPVHAIVPE